MICPLFTSAIMISKSNATIETETIGKLIQCKNECAWFDEETKQCCVKNISNRLTNINRGMAK